MSGRKNCIIPGLNKNMAHLWDRCIPDYYLFGQDLSAKIKEAETVEKSSQALKVPQPKNQTRVNIQSSRAHLHEGNDPTRSAVVRRTSHNRRRQRPNLRVANTRAAEPRAGGDIKGKNGVRSTQILSRPVGRHYE
ncbi:hypothetical protein QAD02_014373 [Eretmocerus hayati]|uniref:Uncharacterized protein n=1 Tax=Eretmocerus hayati TaxID=131215 RepID=A0ACC2P6D6_9HYME|nr:hypothetical protein QAD02_014373 [Eretmocerus hayati]